MLEVSEGLNHWLPLAPGEFARVTYELWRKRVTGVLTVGYPGGHRQVLVLHRGLLMTADADALGRRASQTLETLCSWRSAYYHFDDSVAAHPPGGRRFHLGRWVRQHLESQVDGQMAKSLTQELAGIRLVVKSGLIPEDICDETDRRILLALSEPRRLDQAWSLARCPRFRLLAFVHFLRQLGALELRGVVAPRPNAELDTARRLLGVTDTVDQATIKRVYRQQVRELHPDLRPTISSAEKRRLEAQLSRVNRAYQLLMA